MDGFVNHFVGSYEDRKAIDEKQEAVFRKLCLMMCYDADAIAAEFAVSGRPHLAESLREAAQITEQSNKLWKLRP